MSDKINKHTIPPLPEEIADEILAGIDTSPLPSPGGKTMMVEKIVAKHGLKLVTIKNRTPRDTDPKVFPMGTYLDEALSGGLEKGQLSVICVPPAITQTNMAWFNQRNQSEVNKMTHTNPNFKEELKLALMAEYPSVDVKTVDEFVEASSTTHLKFPNMPISAYVHNFVSGRSKDLDTSVFAKPLNASFFDMGSKPGLLRSSRVGCSAGELVEELRKGNMVTRGTNTYSLATIDCVETIKVVERNPSGNVERTFLATELSGFKLTEQQQEILKHLEQGLVEKNITLTAENDEQAEVIMEEIHNPQTPFNEWE